MSPLVSDTCDEVAEVNSQEEEEEKEENPDGVNGTRRGSVTDARMSKRTRVCVCLSVTVQLRFHLWASGNDKTVFVWICSLVRPQLKVRFKSVRIFGS